MRPCIAIVLALFVSGLATAEEPAVRVAGSERPPVLDLLGEAGADLLAVAISADGNRAAMAVDVTEKGPRSELQLFEVGRELPVAVAVKGRIRDMLFSRDGSTVYGLQHFSAKKREGDTFLLSVDWALAKAVRGMRLPASAKGLDHWIARDALLIAARNEIRTIFLPGLTSGPLFRVQGENSAVASIGGDVVLVGQDDGLALVDLGVPSGREAMPFADRTDTPDAVVSLAAEPDGRGALARLAGGRVFSVELGPLALGDALGSTGDVTVPVRRGPAEDPEPPEIATVEPTPPPPPVEAVAEPEPEPEPVEVATPEPAPIVEEIAEPRPVPVEAPTPPPPPVEAVAGPDPVPEPVEIATPEPPPPPPLEVVEPEPAPPVEVEEPEPVEVATPEPVPPVAPEEQQPTPEPVEAEPSELAPQIQGLIEGPEAGRVESVVLFGPDNILREAARVTPVQGRWKVDALAPGRYRVQLDGGGSSVLVTEPPFLLLNVTSDEPVQAPVFKVVRTL